MFGLLGAAALGRAIVQHDGDTQSTELAINYALGTAFVGMAALIARSKPKNKSER